MFTTRSLIRSSFILLTLFLVTPQLYATASRNDVKLLEASEDIKLISQQVVKDYFYSSLYKDKKEIAKSLNDGVLALDEKLRLIASTTKNEDTKNVLTFLAFSRDEISEIIEQEFSLDNAALMLDNSEVLLEGAESIVKEHEYNFSLEEKMLIKVKKMAYLIERITKYYMAVQVGFNDHNNIKQLNIAIDSFDRELAKLATYNYSGRSAKDFNTIKEYWPVAKKFYLSLQKRKLPNILYISAQHLENKLVKLELYHSKNQ